MWSKMQFYIAILFSLAKYLHVMLKGVIVFVLGHIKSEYLTVNYFQTFVNVGVGRYISSKISFDSYLIPLLWQFSCK